MRRSRSGRSPLHDGADVDYFSVAVNDTRRTGSAVTNDPDLSGGMGCATIAGSSSALLQVQFECSGTSTDSGSLIVRVRRAAPADASVRYRSTVGAE